MANIHPYGRFTHAVVRGIPESFGKPSDNAQNGERNGGGGGGGVEVDLAKAQRQFGCLTGALRQKVGLQLIEIPPDPELPESWRIEDVAVIQGDTALVTRPYHQQRRSEAEALRGVLSELRLSVVEMGEEQGGSGGATLEGSDVLFTGREFFVGVSSHTNRRGAQVLADTFRSNDIISSESTRTDALWDILDSHINMDLCCVPERQFVHQSQTKTLLQLRDT
uniref:Dimethylargininase n=1 Tax=Knipowitschia caucasica TaxID=637954 RepID=A0AAV2K3B5_KNICA